MIAVEPSDRVLLLVLPPLHQLMGLAQKLPEGLLVALVQKEDLHETRRACRDCDNVMVVPADPEGLIPWRDGFFSKIYAPGVEGLGEEVHRVLGPGGQIIR